MTGPVPNPVGVRQGVICAGRPGRPLPGSGLADPGGYAVDAATVRAWALASARALAEARGPIDSLNVFPVPDGDTGTNLALTVAEGAEHVAHPDPDADAAQVAAAFARGALLGARGNSGVIVSQYLHGFAAGLASADPVAAGRVRAGGGSGLVLATALDQAQRAARAAVARPVEGTILSAATAASGAATTTARAGGTAEATAAAAVRGARAELARSPQALDVLRAAGVVDAGASGLVVLLESLAAVVRGAAALTGEIARVVADVPRGGPAPDPHGRGAHDGAEADGADGEFEVMFVVAPHRPATAEVDLAPGLSARMQELGGSVAVVGGPDGWHVHVHTRPAGRRRRRRSCRRRPEPGGGPPARPA
jgi:dihydroxyacetone kinase-like predicted kinase